MLPTHQTQSIFHNSPADRGPLRRKALLVVLLSGTIFALLLAELGLRLFWTPVVTENVETRAPHPDYGFAPIAGAKGRFARTEYNVSFQHTLQRLRGDRLRHAERAPGIRGRVLFLGDSFTYGITTEEPETFVGRLQAKWPDVEMINSGCTGYGQREELAVLDKLGGALKPDVTVLSFFWNDLEDIMRPEPAYGVNAEGHVRRVSPPDAPSDPLKLWPAETVLPRSKWKTCYVFQLLLQSTGSIRHHYMTHGGMRPRSITTGEQKEAAWKLLEQQLPLLKLRAAELGTRLMLVAIPDYNQIDPASVIASIKPLNFEVQERLAALCTKDGIEFHDALGAMKAAFDANGGAAGAKRKPLYFEVDRHFTAEGNRVYGEYLAQLLEPVLLQPR